MTGVTIGLGDHGIKIFDRCISVGARLLPQTQDLLSRLISSGTHVSVQLGVVVEPPQRFAARPIERFAQVPRGHAGD